MCFQIHKNAKGPDNKTVWKVVRLRASNNRVESRIHNYLWETGEHKIPKEEATSYRSAEPGPPCSYAQAGFYVYLDREDAIAHLHGGTSSVLLKLTVSPSDFLFRGLKSHGDHNVATYRRVYVPVKQPYITWY